jgi:hypothetical protein
MVSIDFSSQSDLMHYHFGSLGNVLTAAAFLFDISFIVLFKGVCCDLLSSFCDFVFNDYICYEANHNKDYSVVKTFKAGQLAFFVSHNLSWRKIQSIPDPAAIRWMRQLQSGFPLRWAQEQRKEASLTNI